MTTRSRIMTRRVTTLSPEEGHGLEPAADRVHRGTGCKRAGKRENEHGQASTHKWSRAGRGRADLTGVHLT